MGRLVVAGPPASGGGCALGSCCGGEACVLEVARSFLSVVRCTSGVPLVVLAVALVCAGTALGAPGDFPEGVTEVSRALALGFEPNRFPKNDPMLVELGAAQATCTCTRFTSRESQA